MTRQACPQGSSPFPCTAEEKYRRTQVDTYATRVAFVEPILTISLARGVALIPVKKLAKPRIPRVAIPICFMAFEELRSGLVSFPVSA